MKSPTSEKEKEASPAYESHLRKYKQARAALFDRPTRKFAASNSPQGELTTVRVESRGNPGKLRNALSGSNSRLPFGGSTPDIRFKSFREPTMNNAASLPSQYREETTTSETITTVNGQTVNGQEVPEQKPKTPSSTVHNSPTRLRHSNLGFKEKIIIPTKYKTASEIAAAAKPERASMNSNPAREVRTEIKTSSKSFNPDEPSFLGSTFEKFSFKGTPLMKPTFTEETTASKRKPVFGDSFGFSSESQAKRKPVSDSETRSTSNSDGYLSRSVGNLQDWSSVHSSTPVNLSESIQYISSSEKRSLPFGSPVERSIPVRNVTTLEKPIPQFEKSSNVIQPPEENNVTLGTENSAFSAPFRSKAEENPAKDGEEGSGGEKIMYSRIRVNKSPSSKSSESIVVPVVKVNTFANQGEVRVPIGSPSGRLTDSLTGCPVLELEEEGSNFTSTVNGFRDSSGKISDSSGILHSLLQPDLNNNERNSSQSNVTDPSVNKENQGLNERVIMPSMGRTKPVFGSSSQRTEPLFTSSLQNLSTRVRESTPRSMDALPTGEKIIIPSKYRQKPTETAAPSNVIDSGSTSTPDISLNKENRIPGNSSSTAFRQHGLDRAWDPLSGDLMRQAGSELDSSTSLNQPTRREKPVFPDFSNSTPDISRISRPFQEDSSQRNSVFSLKKGNDSALSINEENIDSSFSSPKSRRNESGEMTDSGIWKDPDEKPAE
uniref:Regeneration-upregulated protein 4 n=1 Tax=Enchytraeus japonensis TaxID=228735 RepID=Q1MXG2_9ANNE|nr:regeneration-upregulated protein 4 [Enchytraeus japonensis]